MRYAKDNGMPTCEPEIVSPRSRTLKCLEQLPALSPVSSQLLAKLARPQCNVTDLTGLVGRDAVLAAQILRLANSAAFGRAQQISSIKHAIAMVGVGTMRKFMLASSLSNLFARFRKPPGFSLARFNLHAVAVATLVELMAEDLPLDERHSAFVAGLLHDIGKMVIAVSLPREFENLLGVAAVSGLPLWECEREVLGTDHAEISGLAAQRWGLAAPIACAVACHHEPDRAKTFEQTAPGRLGLSLVIHKADAFVNYLGLGLVPPSAVRGEPPSLEFPGIPFTPERALKNFELQIKTLSEVFH